MSLESFKQIYNNLRTNLTLLNKYLEYKNYGQPNIEKCTNSQCTKEKLSEILYEF